jgi:hypothetical protein
MNRNIYNISDTYEVMNSKPAQLGFLNKIGLRNAPNYTIVKNEVLRDCCGYQYPNDGRMKDARGMEITLDRPAQIGWVGMDETLNIDNSNYRNFYDNYEQMNNAQISYYVDKSISHPFFGPVYALSSTVDKTIFVDPMGSHKPTYFKNPISSSLNNVSADQATRDQLSFRDDIMSKQQGLYNRTSWVNLNM